MAKDIYVYADWEGLQQPTQIGTLSAAVTKGKEIFSFSYAQTWLDSGHAQLMDPDLQQFAGPQYLGTNKTNFGLFLDSSPDRWGRMLMDRREAILARKNDRIKTTFHESDYLLGVYDVTRMGGLRFKTDLLGEFLANSKDLAAPPFLRLRELEQASLNLEKNKLSATEELKWLGMLIAPGSSLGGARPKASVTDPKGELWIAKFPSGKDTYDIGAWEMVTHHLATDAGICMAEAKAKKYTSTHHTFLTKRFDRTPAAERIHFASAMTLLGELDGADASSGSSYLDLAAVLIQGGQNVSENLEQLWTRILFNIMVSNTDDHLRNHGFLLRKGGWELSPAYDINPNPKGTGLTLNISTDDNSLDIDLALSVAQHFRVKEKQAKAILEHMTKVVYNWRKIAKVYGISRKEQEDMAQAFTNANH